jgi:flagellar hook-associated protein 1
VVSAAQTLAQGINTRSQAITAQSQAAQNDIVNCVNTINTTLSTIGTLSNQIIQAQAAGSSTADLENQRQSEINTLSQYLSINVLPQSNGDVLVTTSSGLELPTRSTTGPLSTSDATVGPTSYYPGGGLPAVTLNGQDITTAITGGQLGADLSLRDSVLPTQQAALDEFSANLASRFGDQGLALFTDGTGKIPSLTGPYTQSGYVGFAATIQVNPVVQNMPSLVRDGTPSTNTTDATGYNTVITNVLNGTFGTVALRGILISATTRPRLSSSSQATSAAVSRPLAATRPTRCRLSRACKRRCRAGCRRRPGSASMPRCRK